ncbi:MAG: hypothetical protein RLY16_2008 [Bacteroidota bacterium]|jgi:alpha-beta hydrolase superfamily lysophospholipase
MKKGLLRLLKITGVVFVLFNVIVAIHAYKFTHFYEANERPIKDTGKVSGWQITKTIFTGINGYKWPSNPTDSSVETVYLSTKDKYKLEGWYIKTDLPAKGTVILFHGHGGNKAGVRTEAKSFRELGYNTLMIDFRAHGNSTGNTCTIGYQEAEDVWLAYRFAKEVKGQQQIILWGISMGAATITKALNDYPMLINKVILEMPFASIQQAAASRVKMMGLPGEPLATFLTCWGGWLHGFWGFDMAPAEYAHNIKVPVLLQWGNNDPRVLKEETDAIFAALPGTKKLMIYEDAGHESLCKYDHAKWMRTVQSFLQ